MRKIFGSDITESYTGSLDTRARASGLYTHNKISQNGWGYGNGDLRTAVLGHGHMGGPLN